MNLNLKLKSIHEREMEREEKWREKREERGEKESFWHHLFSDYPVPPKRSNPRNFNRKEIKGKNQPGAIDISSIALLSSPRLTGLFALGFSVSPSICQSVQLL